MIQWRNLNYDPQRYLALMQAAGPSGRPVGLKALLKRLGKRFPALRHGYFNPPKESWTAARRQSYLAGVTENETEHR
jgi:hypothetical protein